MDIASLIGMGAGTLMVLLAIISGGNPGDYVNGQGIMIVLGGTVAATLLNFRLKDVIRAYKSVARVFSTEREKPIDTLIEVLKLNDIVRKNGRLALDKYMKESNNMMKNRIMRKAIQLSIDNLSEEDTVIALRTEIDSVKIRDTINQEVFKRMAIYAPSMGMIGTLIGLVEMLGSMSNPAELGPAMALALLTTFYGAFLATLIFLQG
jgi:chemotaxis protein MotA